MQRRKIKIIIYLCQKCGDRFESSGGAKKVASASDSDEHFCGQQYTSIIEAADDKEVCSTTETTILERPGGKCSGTPTSAFRLRL